MSSKHNQDNYTQVSAAKNDFSIFDNGPEEPKLCALSGYDDCENCYFRASTIKRITLRVQKLQKEAL